MTDWRESESKKHRLLTNWYDHLNFPAIYVGLATIAVSAVLVFVPIVNQKEIMFFLLGTGVTIIANELFNVPDRLNTYLRERSGSRRLYSVSERTLAELRVAAQLGICLYYLCIDKVEQLRERSRMLSASLGVSDVIEQIITKSENASADVSFDLIRYVGRILEDRKGSQISGAYWVTTYVMLAAGSDLRNIPSLIENNQKAKKSIKTRIIYALKNLNADEFVIEYSEKVLNKWLSNGCPDKNLKAYAELMRIYLSSFDIIGVVGQPQEDLPRLTVDLLKKRIEIDKESFLESASSIMQRCGLEEEMGTLEIVSGKGSFVGILKEKKEITARKGEILTGKINLKIQNNLPEYAVAPLILVFSWKQREEGFITIDPWISVKESYLDVNMDFKVPDQPGTYHVMFSFSAETLGHYVASCTNWGIGYPLWDDGNDLKEISEIKVKEAQKNGKITMMYLYIHGYMPTSVPLDAITIHVE